MRCQVCGKGGQIEGRTCRYCGATVRSVLGKGMPLPPGALGETDDERHSRRQHEVLRRRRKLIWHSVAGAIILFGVALWVNAPTFLGGPRFILLGILWAIPVSIIFGVPIGLITSWRNYGPLGGAVVGSLFFTAGIYLCGISSLLICLLLGVMPGIVVGGLIGLHVSSDGD